jgi:glutathione S-transferase
MLIRFVVAAWDEGSPHRLGIFQAARDLRDTGQFTAAELAEADAIMFWLAEHLASPSGHLWSRRRRARAISWFCRSARAHVARARAMAALLERKGLAVALVVTDRPGQVLYEDRQQVVAIPVSGETF